MQVTLSGQSAWTVRLSTLLNGVDWNAVMHFALLAV